MKKLLLIVTVAFGLNTSIALAQHEDMPGHEKMPGHDKMHDGHKMPDSDHAKHRQKDGDANKNPRPNPDDPKHKGHKQP